VIPATMPASSINGTTLTQLSADSFSGAMPLCPVEPHWNGDHGVEDLLPEKVPAWAHERLDENGRHSMMRSVGTGSERS
jgi:hypothetical protein